MKRLVAIISISLLAYILSGCTYWTMSVGNSEPERVAETNETMDDKKYDYNLDVSNYEKIVLNLDIDVSDVTLKQTDTSQFKLNQRANSSELFVVPSKSENGKTLTLSFKSPDSHKLLSLNTKNSDITIELPEQLIYSVNTSLDVGKFNLKQDILLTVLEVSTDVGDIDVSLSTSQDNLQSVNLSSDVGKIDFSIEDGSTALKSVQLASNVGDIIMKLDGSFPSLTKIENNTSTGKITSKLGGDYGQKIDSTITSDVGKIALDLTGDYKTQSKLITSSSTGGIQISINSDLPIKLDAQEEEFVSKIKLNSIESSHIDDLYYLNGASPDHFTLTIEADSDVGNIEIVK